jgi:hypothetical protein
MFVDEFGRKSFAMPCPVTAAGCPTLAKNEFLHRSQGRLALIPVRALDFVRYNAKDVRKTHAFYQQLIGFKRGFEWTEI